MREGVWVEGEKGGMCGWRETQRFTGRNGKSKERREAEMDDAIWPTCLAYFVPLGTPLVRGAASESCHSSLIP